MVDTRKASSFFRVQIRVCVCVCARQFVLKGVLRGCSVSHHSKLAGKSVLPSQIVLTCIVLHECVCVYVAIGSVLLALFPLR